MTDIWDFSSLLEKWSSSTSETATPVTEIPELKTKMDEELKKCTTQLELLNSGDIADNNNLLAPPPPKNRDRPLSGLGTPRKLEAITPKAKSRAAPVIIKPPPTARRQKPKEAMQMKAKKTFVSNTKFDPTAPIFKAMPHELRVVNFTLNTEYIMNFTVQNISSHTHSFQLRGPTDPAFRFRILEDIGNSLIRPGLTLTFEVIFCPQEPRDYEGEFLIIPGPDETITKVPLRCYRDPPALELYDIVDLGSTLVHSSKSGSFTIYNKGGIANFSFHSNIGKDEGAYYIDGSFRLYPSHFKLDHNESIEVKVDFKPSEPGFQKASFEILAQYFPQKFYFIVQGESAVPSLHFNINNEDQLYLPFLPIDVNKTKVIEITNDADVSYPYHFNVLPPNRSNRNQLEILYPENENPPIQSQNSPFKVTPLSGIIGPKETIKLSIEFAPKIFALFSTNITMFIEQIPDEKGVLSARKMLNIFSEASSGPPSVFIHPPLVQFYNIIPNTPTLQAIEVLNQSNLEVKLQWRKSEVIAPNPVLFDVVPFKQTKVDLTFLYNKYLKSSRIDGEGIFKHQPQLAQQFNASEIWRISSCNTLPTSSEENLSEPVKTKNRSPSQHYAIQFQSLEPINEQAREAPRKLIQKQLSCMPKNFKELINFPFQDVMDKKAHMQDEVALQLDQFNQMTFTFSAQLSHPILKVEPPIIDFGCVLAGRTAIERIKFVNPFPCPIGFCIIYPDDKEWDIPLNSGFVIDQECADIRLTFDEQTAVDEIITIETFWCHENGEKIQSLPTASYDVPVYAVFDRPIINIENRVIDIGEVYPTLEYSATTIVALMNSFPTPYEVIESTNSVLLFMPRNRAVTSMRSHKDELLEPDKLPVRPKSDLRKANPKLIESITASEEEYRVYEYLRCYPQQGEFDRDHEEQNIEIVACFCTLGEQALPMAVKVTGVSYRCAVIAHVIPPKIQLITENIDFSSDFVICNRSHSVVVVKNECGVESTVRLEMIDNCNKVFSLDDDREYCMGPFASVEIPVSCYSEIHGDYNGKLNLIICDPWQYKEIEIPMHVKAFGSFFGFKKHTLGYKECIDGDYVSFGTEIPLSCGKVIRRLTLVNFSSESIQVDWSLANYVKGRHYVDVDFDINRNGSIAVRIDETEEADLAEPFNILTKQSVIESHGNTVVIIEFVPKERGTFNGCVSARSGEFVHLLGLSATVI